MQLQGRFQSLPGNSLHTIIHSPVTSFTKNPLSVHLYNHYILSSVNLLSTLFLVKILVLINKGQTLHRNSYRRTLLSVFLTFHSIKSGFSILQSSSRIIVQTHYRRVILVRRQFILQLTDTDTHLLYVKRVLT